MGDMTSVFKFFNKLGLLSFVFSLILAVIASPFTALTYAIDAISYADRPAQTGCKNIMFLGALACSQGITNDGESYIFSSKFGFLKTELDGKTWLNFNMDAIPEELKENYNSGHIGGISCLDGKIYAALEDSKKWHYPICAIYDADTLEFSGTYFMLSPELQLKGCPWVAADGERDLIYSAQRDNSPVLICYDITDGSLVKTVELSQPVHKIQGGEMYNGKLYVSTNDATQAVYEINPDSGEVVKCFDRNLTNGSEGEGLTMLKTADGAVFHAIDMGPIFINAFLRHYAPTEGMAK